MNRRLQLITWTVLTILLAAPIFDCWIAGQAVASNATEAQANNIEDNSSPKNNIKTQGQLLATKIKTAAEAILSKLGINLEFAKYYATWIVGAPTLVIVILIAMIFRPRRMKITPASLQRSMAARAKKPLTEMAYKSRQERAPATDKERILRFFFRLFKQQIGTDPDAPTELILVENRPICPNETYEMRIMQGNDWVSRRMSIGLLGQGGGSRSKCYYAIYDSHMVLKIPSEAILGFSAYREKIKGEAHIVERLAPRECIVPRVGVILKAVHAIPGSSKLSEDALEDRYVHLLEVNPDLQEYLKIGTSFAFFMDLARHFFLSSTLEEIHRGDQRIVNEAMKQHELLWDQHGFVCRYGEETGSVCHELQDAYYRCEGRLRQLVQEAHIVEDIPVFQLKQWFLTHLAGEKIYSDNEELPEEFIDRVNRLLTKVIRENHYQAERYRQGVRRYIKEMRFSQHRAQLENLSTNALDLLAWIGQKGLALRDLKPENLFVAGEPDAYPIFLNDSERFSIGLIDVETAVIIDAAKPEDIPQPQLAGTPLYATPTHLIPNLMLHEVYTDVRTILHMQDWYATIAMIYKIITGRNLFAVTARTFPEIVKRIKLIDPAGPDVERDVAAISTLFWNSAMAEFEEGIDKDKDVLTRVEVIIPKTMIADIIKALHRGGDQIALKLKNIISRQSVFSDPQKCRFLIEASVEKIEKMTKKLSDAQPGSGEHTKQRQQALELLEQIQSAKNRLQRKLEAAAALKAKAGRIAADQLLEAMFERVQTAMYLPHWTMPQPAKWSGKSDLPTDIATYQATM
jgi:serine/threonine protein kinase